MTAHRRMSWRTKPLLESFAVLFYICKILCINSQDWKEFRKYKHLKKSATGDGLVVIGVILTFINFNIMIKLFQPQNYLFEKNALVIGINFILAYYSLALFICDRVNALLKQQEFSNIFTQMEEIDQNLKDIGDIVLNNKYITYRLVVGLFLAVLAEVITFVLSFTFYVDKINWTAWLWTYAYIPTFFNTLDKLWYIGILTAIMKRFEAINKAFEIEALRMGLKRLPLSAKKSKRNKNGKKSISNNQIRPDNIYTIPRHGYAFADTSTPNTSVGISLEEKFIKYCQLHDTLCGLAKQLNKIYALPNILQMGYGFCTITAQLYFLYSAYDDQEIPSMFCTVRNWCISLIYISYLSAKCISILYINWLTRLESKKTGICIHRCGIAADDNYSYEMINHLLLKLFNHHTEFNNCGYFPLSMKTLFSFCGGITTYLIILIQFNLEQQQIKFKSGNGKLMALTGNDSFITKDVGNTTSS